MPSKPPTLRARHAPTLAQQRASYDRRRDEDPALGEAARLRRSGKFNKRFLPWFRGAYPMCCDPCGLHIGRLVPAAHCHHIRGLAAHHEDICDEDWCAPLCVRCHGEIEAMVRAGKDTVGLFTGWRGRAPYG